MVLTMIKSKLIAWEWVFLRLYIVLIWLISVGFNLVNTLSESFLTIEELLLHLHNGLVLETLGWTILLLIQYKVHKPDKNFLFVYAFNKSNALEKFDFLIAWHILSQLTGIDQKDKCAKNHWLGKNNSWKLLITQAKRSIELALFKRRNVKRCESPNSRHFI